MLTARRDRSALRPLRGCPRLMIVAHPDDETFWGGMTLAAQDGWGVLCLTNRGDRRRRTAFERAMREFRCTGVILDIPDRKEHPPTDADEQRIRTVLATLMHDGQPAQVMTHGPDGEYGHPMHRAVFARVHDMVPDPERLWVFDFDPERDARTADPGGWSRKAAAIRHYLGSPDSWVDSDRAHVELGMHEAPVPLDSYARPVALLHRLYAGTGMEIE